MSSPSVAAMAPPPPGADGPAPAGHLGRPHPLRRLVTMRSLHEMVATSVRAAGADDGRAGGAGEHADAAGDRDDAHGVMGLLLPLLRGPSVRRWFQAFKSSRSSWKRPRRSRPDPPLEPAGCWAVVVGDRSGSAGARLLGDDLILIYRDKPPTRLRDQLLLQGRDRVGACPKLLLSGV